MNEEEFVEVIFQRDLKIKHLKEDLKKEQEQNQKIKKFVFKVAKRQKELENTEFANYLLSGINCHD